MEKFFVYWEGIIMLYCFMLFDMVKVYLRNGLKVKVREMFFRIEEDYIDYEFYVEFLMLYGEVGEREDVYCIWDLYKMIEK